MLPAPLAAHRAALLHPRQASWLERSTLRASDVLCMRWLVNGSARIEMPKVSHIAQMHDRPFDVISWSSQYSRASIVVRCALGSTREGSFRLRGKRYQAAQEGTVIHGAELYSRKILGLGDELWVSWLCGVLSSCHAWKEFLHHRALVRNYSLSLSFPLVDSLSYSVLRPC